MATVKRGQNADFPKSEYRQRYKRLWKLMREHGLDGLLITNKPNHRYLSGHHSEFSISTSRPMFTVVAVDKQPVTLSATLEKDVMFVTSHLEDTRHYTGFADDSIAPLVDVFKDIGLKRGRVGVDFGQEMHMALPMTVFRNLEKAAKGIRFVDGSPALWKLRQIKSPAEVEVIRKSCHASSKGLMKALRSAKAGMTERAVHQNIFIEILRAGADTVPFLPIHSGPGNYNKYGMTATDRKIQKGDIVWSDPACTIKGYYSDFDRMVAVGKATADQKEIYSIIYDVTTECVDAIQPGRPISDAVTARDKSYKRRGLTEMMGFAGRMGHASGLEMTEPPSVAAFDRTVLEPGMIIHLEPKLARPFGGFLLEEVVAVTKTGYDYLTPRAPKELPVVG